MQLWNTRTRAKETFVAPPVVRMYVCGITPYATTHLGHARTYLVFDVLIREVERRGHRFRYTQNVTDVDDPLFERAKQLGVTTVELARECTRTYQDDMAALRIRPPDFFPRASDEIPDIHRLIARLVDGGHAYQRKDRVFYRVRSFAHYGGLSRLDRDQMVRLAGEHLEDPNDKDKEDPLDFVLWKPSRPGESSWPSPWGRGRPGWHIECSAMALRYLGSEIDVHGGGTDLIYPHHENEMAQSEAGSGRSPFARFWIHVEMVRLDGIKMSKSLGNLVLIRDLRSRVNPLAIRHYLLRTHYRAFLDYAESDLLVSAERMAVLERALARSRYRVDAELLATLIDRFDAALADDLDTPVAVDALDAAARLVLAAPADAEGNSVDATLRQMAARLGLSDPSV